MIAKFYFSLMGRFFIFYQGRGKHTLLQALVCVRAYIACKCVCFYGKNHFSYYFKNLNSTRLFFFLPSSVELSAIFFVAPYPIIVKIAGSHPCLIR